MNEDEWNQENGSGIDEDEDGGNEGNNKESKSAGLKLISHFFKVRHDGMAPGTSAPTSLHVLASATAPIIDQASLSQSTSTNINQSDAAELLDVSGGDSICTSSPPSHTNSQPDPSDINVDSAPSNALVDTCDTSDPSRLKAIEDGATDDATMRPATPAVSPSPKSQNDDNLPTWLTQVIKYLRDVAEDTAWQDLVTEFVDFERHDPRNGVSFTVSFMSFFIKYLFQGTEPFYQVETQGGL